MLQEGEGGLLVPPREKYWCPKRQLGFLSFRTLIILWDENYSSYYLLVLCMQIYDFFLD